MHEIATIFWVDVTEHYPLSKEKVVMTGNNVAALMSTFSFDQVSYHINPARNNC